jgi:hypothetical protein
MQLLAEVRLRAQQAPRPGRHDAQAAEPHADAQARGQLLGHVGPLERRAEGDAEGAHALHERIDGAVVTKMSASATAALPSFVAMRRAV